ncbi:MAG: 1-acyl-sn-glycerol-3-phosphate acyltransferase [bacterium]|nr:1-acyl-sn-glycerol-3-phosphate acyltransferase [bacterium]
MKLFPRLYSIYAALLFIVFFAILLPGFLLAIHIKPLQKFGLFLNHIWAKLFFIFMFMPVKIDWRFKLDRKQQYIFCPNHFSYLDIATSGLIPIPFKFMGKVLGVVPVFGYMYRKLHILVDRSKVKSRGASLKLAMEAIDNGFSLTIFPEGGMLTKNPPNMVKFKDGAFRTAIEKGVPIVPVTYPYNYQIFPDDPSMYMYWKRNKIVFHEPIQTSDMTIEDVGELKQKAQDVISKELMEHFAENQVKSH